VRFFTFVLNDKTTLYDIVTLNEAEAKNETVIKKEAFVVSFRGKDNPRI